MAKETTNLLRKSNYHRITILGILSQIITLDIANTHILEQKELSLLRFGSHTLVMLLEPLIELTKDHEVVLLEVCGDETFVGVVASFIDSIAKMLKSYSKESDSVDLL